MRSTTLSSLPISYETYQASTTGPSSPRSFTHGTGPGNPSGRPSTFSASLFTTYLAPRVCLIHCTTLLRISHSRPFLPTFHLMPAHTLGIVVLLPVTCFGPCDDGCRGRTMYYYRCALLSPRTIPTDQELEVLRTGCFKYFELGGRCVRDPVSLLAG